jgi:hypothetical protein
MAHDEDMNVSALPKIISDAYTMFDSIDLSITSLVLIGLVLTIVFLFAAREAATWFFKIDDIKKDVKKVSQLVIDLEAEVRLLQGLLTQNITLATDRLGREASTSPVVTPMPLLATEIKKPDEKAPPRFTVTH